MYLCFDISIWNGVFLMAIADLCQSLAFSVYKAIESLLLGEVGASTPGLGSLLLNFAVLLLGGALLLPRS